MLLCKLIAHKLLLTCNIAGDGDRSIISNTLIIYRVVKGGISTWRYILTDIKFLVRDAVSICYFIRLKISLSPVTYPILAFKQTACGKTPESSIDLITG